MRARMRLLTMHPEDLRAGLLEDLALFLDRRCVDPVLGIENATGTHSLSFEHALNAGKRPGQL